MVSMKINEQLQGVELYFEDKPNKTTLEKLRTNGFRWSNFKKCWYAKQSEKIISIAKQYTQEQAQAENVQNHITEAEKVERVKKVINTLSLWDSTQYTQSEQEIDKSLRTKEIAKALRQEVKRFPQVKFSITSDHNSINFYIVSSPYEKESIYIEAITKYCKNLIDAYKYCTCEDPYGDYGSSYNFYGGYVQIDYKYTQNPITEAIQADMIDFDKRQEEQTKQEEEKKEREYQEYLKKQEEKEVNYKISEEKSKREIENINLNVNITELEEAERYFINGSMFANMNKNQRLEQYQEEVLKGDCYPQNVKITRELHFKNEEAYNNFTNHLLTDFDFLQNSGGSYTDDVRINSMTDYYNMTKEEQETVIFNLYGIAVFLNDNLKFIVDTQGSSYARYVGLVEGVTKTKENKIKPFINAEELEVLKAQADTLTDYSVEVITELDILKTWNTEEWNVYKDILKEKLKENKFKLTKAIIQQLTDQEVFKSAMYKLLVEVDGIQEQFKNANIKQGEKVTLFYISDFGGIITERITVEEVTNSQYAQYDKAIKITYTPQNKRKQYYKHFYSDMLVYNGWLDLPKNVLHIQEESQNFIITKSKYSSCDKSQYDAIIEHFQVEGITPIVNTHKPII